MIPQYTNKTIPKKITKLKKTKEHRAKFYTDLSDSENCDVIVDESNDSLDIKTEDDLNEISEDCEKNNDLSNNTIEQVVSDLLMQNEDFQKVLKKQRTKLTRDSEILTSNTWSKNDEILPAKADSLPRSFQLSENNEDKTKEINDSQDNIASSNIDEGEEHPEHKIYRKSVIRFSILQKFRALLSEEQKNKQCGLTYKQTSKSIGARIANPDYEDPHRLLFTSTPTSSQSSLSLYPEEIKINEDFDLIGEPEALDMSLNENDVLTIFEKRLKETKESDITNSVDAGQNISSHYQKSVSLSEICGNDNNYIITCERSNSDIFSSQNSDSYYESILENKLNGVNIARNGSFRTSTNEEEISNNQTTNNKISHEKLLKRPNKAPPPIPTKPKFLTNVYTTFNVKKEYFNNKQTQITTRDNNSVSLNRTMLGEENAFRDSKGWVKTMVERFD